MRIIRSTTMMAIIAFGLGACGMDSKRMAFADDSVRSANQLPVNNRPRRLALNGATTIGVKEDGTVWGWGGDAYGELGNGLPLKTSWLPLQISEISRIVEVAIGDGHVLARDGYGNVWSWGKNSHGQLGYASSEEKSCGSEGVLCQPSPKKISALRDIVSVAAVGNASYALDKMGNLHAWGSMASIGYPISLEKEDIITQPTVIFSFSGAVRLVKNMVITRDGQLYVWGVWPPTSIKRHQSHLSPQRYDPGFRVADVALGGRGIFLSQDGHVWEGKWQGVSSVLKKDYVLQRIPTLDNIVQIADGGLALDNRGRLWHWGENVRWQPRPGDRSINRELVPVEMFKLKGIAEIYAGLAKALFTENGQVYFWGAHELGSRGVNKMSPQYITDEDWVTPELSLWRWK